MQGARATAVAQQLPHEVLTAAQSMQRFPGARIHTCVRADGRWGGGASCTGSLH